MPLFLAKYYIRWQGTSHDERDDRFHQVIISAKTFDSALETIEEVEENAHQYCKVEFHTIEKLDNVVLWK